MQIEERAGRAGAREERRRRDEPRGWRVARGRRSCPTVPDRDAV